MMLAILIVSVLDLALLVYLVWPERPPPVTPERTEQGYLATARELIKAPKLKPRAVIVADDMHQARLERQAHKDGAGLNPPPRYR